MLSVFPELLTYSLIAPFVLRIALGCYFIAQGIRRRNAVIKSRNASRNDAKPDSPRVEPILTKIQIVIGIFLFAGLYTQVAAILAILFVWFDSRAKSKIAKLSFEELWAALFATATGISLLFLGAGFLAFDLPL